MSKLPDPKPIPPWKKLPWGRFSMFGAMSLGAHPDSGQVQWLMTGTCIRCDNSIRKAWPAPESAAEAGDFYSFHCDVCGTQLFVQLTELAEAVNFHEQIRKGKYNGKT